MYFGFYYKVTKERFFLMLGGEFFLPIRRGGAKDFFIFWVLLDPEGVVCL
jgi:hypothetical protein